MALKIDKTILVIDDDSEIIKTYSDILSKNNYLPLTATTPNEAINIFKTKKISAVLLDYNLGNNVNGLNLLNSFIKLNPLVPVVIVTGIKKIEIVVEAIKKGAYDFIFKPPNFSRLKISLDRAIENFQLKEKVNILDASVKWLLGESDIAKEIILQIQQIAKTNFVILLEGETGTGKSFIANLIHQFSDRKDKAFIKMDIGAIPEALIEKELFGSEKGAYTGADKRQPGYFQAAHQGTLFIDELENTSALVQSKLLSVIEDKKVNLVGSTKSINCDFRLICATNKNIKICVNNNELRKDLLYRLAEFVITIPPLRSRPKDILVFAKRFLADANDEMNKRVQYFSNEAKLMLTEYKWPGNVRELKTVIRKAVLLCKNYEISKKDLKFFNTSENKIYEKDFTMKKFVNKAEIEAIHQALERSNGNKSKSAKILEISYKTLLTKIKDYNLE